MARKDAAAAIGLFSGLKVLQYELPFMQSALGYVMLHDVLLQLRLELRTYISMNAQLQNSPLCVCLFVCAWYL